MSKLPSVSGQQVVAALQQMGFRIRRQHGSHIIMRRDDPFAQTVVPATLAGPRRMTYMASTQESTRYWLANSKIADDGAVIYHVSSRDPAEAGWGTVRRCAPEFPDYGFWRWVVERRERWPDSVSEEEVSKMRLEYEKTIG